MKTNSRYQKLVVLGFVLAGLILSSNPVNAATLIDDDFSSGGTSNSSRIRSNQADLGWYKNSNASEWGIGSGVMSSSGTAGGVATEGALSYVIDTSAIGGYFLNLSFDYVVGATSTLKFALIGYTANLQTGQSASNTLLMNNGTSNGALQNNTQAELRHGDINLLTGADMTQSITNDLTFGPGTSGTYSAQFNLQSYSWHADEDAGAGNTPGLSGGITGVFDFDHVVLVVVNDLSTTVGSSVTTLDNFFLSATVAPEPSTIGLVAMGAMFLYRKRARC